MALHWPEALRFIVLKDPVKDSVRGPDAIRTACA